MTAFAPYGRDSDKLALLSVLLKAADHHDESQPDVKYDLDALAAQAVPAVTNIEGLLKLIFQLAPVVAALIAALKSKSGPKPEDVPPPVVVPPVVTPPVVVPPTTPPVTPGLVFPDEVVLVKIEASHPAHGDLGECPISPDGVIGTPPALGSSNFDDNTDFVLEIGYKKAGVGIHFDNTPNASHLKNTSRFEFRVSGRSAVARFSATECSGAGFMADGGQIKKRLAETQGMDPTFKFPAKKAGGPSGGEVVTMDIFAPDGEGDEVGRRYTFAPFN